MVLNREFLFIIGSPRSGTTWLQVMLGAHPQVCTTVELTLFTSYTAPWIRAWKSEADNIKQGRWDQGLPFLWTEDEFYDFLRDFLWKVYLKVLENNPQATHVLDKHPGYSLFTEDIKQLIPNARFIHIIRDGRDVVASMLAANRDMGFGTATMDASAREWKDSLIAARRAKQYTGQYLELRYEDLLRDTPNILAQVYDFCGLAYTAEQVSSIVDEHRFETMKQKGISADPRSLENTKHFRKGKAGSWQEDLDLSQRSTFDSIAGDLLRELGYAEDHSWVNMGLQVQPVSRFDLKTLGKRIYRKLVK